MKNNPTTEFAIVQLSLPFDKPPTSKKYHLEGQVFGQLTVLRLARYNGESRWECSCTCGKTTYCRGVDLTSGNTTSCGCKLRLSLTPGQQFGYLTIIKFDHIHPQTKRTYWLCRCKCGKEVVRCGAKIVYRAKKGVTSGCSKCVGAYSNRSRRLPDNLSARNDIISDYRHNACLKGLDIELTPEEFGQLFKGNCYYCGRPPSRVRKMGQDRENYVFNGIDRLNNSLGYIHGNVVSCCTQCNYKKGDQSYDDFIHWIAKVASNLRL